MVFFGFFLRQVANAHLRSFVHGKFGNVLLIQEYGTFVGLDQSHYHVKSSGLPGSIRTQQTNNFSLFYIYAYMVYHCTAFVTFQEMFGMYGQIHRLII